MSEPRSPALSHERLRALYTRALAGTVPPSGDLIYALPIPGFEAHRLGRDRDGSVCLIVASGAVDHAAQPDIRLENLSVRRRVPCEITQPTGTHESVVGTVITCSADSAEVRWLFLDVLDQALETMGPAPNESDINDWVDHARRLFAELESPAPRELRGLWGELLVMCESSDPESLIRRWHEDPLDRFEFVYRNYALVVKTCGELDRVHRFTLTQLREPNMEVVIASVPVQSNPQGQSVIDLLRELDARLIDRHVRNRLREIAFQMGGAALASANARFDRETAREGYCLMRAQSIPAIAEQLPPSVRSVQLDIDCEDVQKEDLAETVVTRLRS